MPDSLVPLLRWLAAQDEGASVIVSCPKAPPVRPRPRDVAVTWDTCLASASSGTVAQLLAVGVDHVYVNHCGCAEQRFTSWESITPGRVSMYVPGRRSLRSGVSLRLTEVPLPRRAVFGLAISAPISFDDDDQDRTLHSLEVLGLGEEASSRLTDQPQSLVLQASGCTMCGVCVKACPHDALAIEPAKENSTSRMAGSRLIYAVDACRGCNRCIDLCPVSALESHGPESWENVRARTLRVLAQQVMATCESCGAPVQDPSKSLCALCEYRQEHPFESVPLDMMRQLLKGTSA
ncbi:4Fe-4S dicluster domain-containing protein [Arcanobacterium haemolyticum]|uniref:4Fe-4S ferredoxin iron-sulfur binding domain protein n=1 Tax=Arcanobacterium haemolyticum (strain ATCC 9345 / DSM 20595 / CCM 5947 / CCUG 17215 / LMG 16163 / NBRC 15585 / NCTC 8452 / 11018) TaxID=644284 RepID=D7BJX7_ARCHD|nr:4Fe-4S dicluster domain-containing protein [Arcanobacterium haemolyticum]ADH92957.1 4Fe-4S ferredoxin iron-sulfur binding domain protein [Arcanobacterium haemolyticum DSM 20595]QCX47031.1 4Fe-4S dicluster domain-containing protein [Arcanobacterium haemolyticum]SQH28287.1 Uncharacterized Fe-S center protein [Arcanobacterium haemolyticum]